MILPSLQVRAPQNPFLPSSILQCLKHTLQIGIFTSPAFAFYQFSDIVDIFTSVVF
jgi:hypothetical protein